MEYVFEKIFSDCLFGKLILTVKRGFAVGKNIYYNPASKSGELVRIFAGDYEVSRFGNIMPYPDNDSRDNGDFVKTDSSELLELIGQIVSVPRSEKLILAVFLLAVFAGIQTPILCVTGTPGSGKTELTKRLVNIFDPRKKNSPVSGFPSNEDDLQIHLNNKQICAFDNLEEIGSKKINALLCQSVTGACVEVRKFYTNSEMVSHDLQCPIILTSVTCPITAGDLLSRTLQVEVPPITRKSFCTTKQLAKDASLINPKILGAVFDALSKYLCDVDITDSIECDTRLCDFYKFGMLISPYIGSSSAEFSEAFHANQRENRISTANASPVINAIQKLLKQHKGYIEMSAEELRNEVIRISGMTRSENGIPKNPTQMSTYISNNCSLLKDVGIDFGRNHGARRTLWFKDIGCSSSFAAIDTAVYDSKYPVGSDTASPDDSNDSDDSTISCELDEM